MNLFTGKLTNYKNWDGTPYWMYTFSLIPGEADELTDDYSTFDNGQPTGNLDFTNIKDHSLNQYNVDAEAEGI